MLILSTYLSLNKRCVAKIAPVTSTCGGLGLSQLPASGWRASLRKIPFLVATIVTFMANQRTVVIHVVVQTHSISVVVIVDPWRGALVLKLSV